MTLQRQLRQLAHAELTYSSVAFDAIAPWLQAQPRYWEGYLAALQWFETWGVRADAELITCAD